MPGVRHRRGRGKPRLQRLRDAWQDGSAVGPRLWLAGLIDGSGPFAAPIGNRVDTEEEARRLADRLATLGYVQVKLYNSLQPELVPVIIEEARRRGLRVSGHVPAGMRGEEAVRAGFHELNHIYHLAVNFVSEPPGAPPRGLSASVRPIAELELGSAEVRQFVAYRRHRGSSSTPR